jgi:hypothetical protein
MEKLAEFELDVVDAWSDADFDRTEITAVGPNRNHIPAWEEIAEMILPSIDLNRHAGSFPRLGALDLIRFSPVDDDATEYGFGVTFGEFFADRYGVPIYYDGPESEPGSEGKILRLREGGFGGLGASRFVPNFGPPVPHSKWGVTVVEVGPLHYGCHLDLFDPKTTAASFTAARLNELRAEGDELLIGVESAGYPLGSRESSRLCLTFTMPERSDFDAVLRIADREAKLRDAAPGKAYARGAWKKSDAERTFRLIFGREQIVDDGLQQR